MATERYRANAVLEDGPVSLYGAIAASGIRRRLSAAVELQASKDFIAGTVAGVAQVFAGHPFDTLKVRLQTQPGPGDLHSPRFTGALDCLVQTLQKEGARGLYKGMSCPIAFVGLFNAVQFGVYGQAQRWIAGDEPNSAPLSLPQIGMAGAMAGLTVSLVATPSELIKSRLQIQYAHGSTLLSPRYSGPVDCARQVYQTSGLRGLYKGFVPTLLRQGPANFFSFMAYEGWRRSSTPTGETPSSATSLIAGGISGTVYWVSIYPMDVVKNRIQTDLSGRYKGTKQCFQDILRSEGYRGLYKGVAPCLLRAFPANAVTFVTYELISKHLLNPGGDK